MQRRFTYIGRELALFAHATNWKDYLASQLVHFIQGRVLEVGAGIGTNTELLVNSSRGDWTCLEPDGHNVMLLKETVRRRWDRKLPTVIHGTIQNLDLEPRYDTILYLDVLEHIQNDAVELQQAGDLLSSGGRLVVLGPAHNALFSQFDAEIGHYRRYNRKMLRDIAPRGFRLKVCRYLDSIGLMASFANRLILKQKMPSRKQLHTWDRLMVPLSLLIDPLLGYQLGKSILVVWQKP